MNEIFSFCKLKISFIEMFHESLKAHRQISKKRSFIKRQTTGTTSDNEWYNERQRVTTNDND